MTDAAKGILAALGACLIWGCMPLIYKPLSHVPSEEVLAHRMIWSLAFFMGVLVVRGQLGRIAVALNSARNIRTVSVAAAMISVNWFLIIFATATGRNTEGSLGYYIYPLLAVLMGRLLFGETMSRVQIAAVGLAAVAVGVLTVGLGHLPWISIALAASFAYYGVIKKRMRVDAVVSVTAELLMFLPVVAIILVHLYGAGIATFGTAPFETIYMMVSGPVTALPLILFSYAATRVRMSTVGLLLYINPTLQFLTAMLLFGEPFTAWHAVAFFLIWTALALYSASFLRQDRAARRALIAATGVSTTSNSAASDGSAKP